MKELSPSSRQMFYMLLSKHKKFLKKNRLALDGSFYYADTRLAEELFVSNKTIQRAKKQLVEQGYIRIEPGKHKGWATKYWIAPKVDKMSPFKEIAKVDNLPVKDDKVSVKACQNVYPNKVTIKKENKYGCEDESPDLCNLTEDQKEGIRAIVPLWGKERTIRSYLNHGYSRDVLEEVLEGY